MRYLILFAILSAFLAHLLSAEPPPLASADLQLHDDGSGVDAHDGDVYDDDDIEFHSLDLVSLDAAELDALIDEINGLAVGLGEFTMADGDDERAAADGNNGDDGDSDVSAELAGCNHHCFRIYRPVCASFDGLKRTLPSFCDYDNQVRCLVAKRNAGQSSDIAQIEYLHDGACSMDADKTDAVPASQMVLLDEQNFSHF